MGRNDPNQLPTRISNSRGSQGSEVININASDDNSKKIDGPSNVVKELLNRDKNQVMGDFSSLIMAKEETIKSKESAKAKKLQASIKSPDRNSTVNKAGKA